MPLYPADSNQPAGQVTDTNVTASVLPIGASTLTEQQLQTARLVSLDGKNFATELTLSGIKSKTDGLTFSGTRLLVDAALTTSFPTDYPDVGSHLRLDKLTIAPGAAIGTNTLAMVGGKATTSAPTFVNDTINPLSLDLQGNLRVTPSSAGATAPGTVSAGESLNNRAYQTTFEITLGNAGVEGNVVLLRNPSGSGKKAYIRGISFGNTTGASKAGIVRVYQNPTLATAAVIFTDATNLVTIVAHGYLDGDLVSFASIVATTGIIINTNYYVISATANTFQLSLTLAGPAINLVTDGTGSIYRAGVSLVPTSMHIGGGAPKSIIVPTTVPLTSSIGTKLSVSAQTNEQASLDYDWGLIVAQGSSLLVTGTGTANNVPLVINIIWSDAT